MTEKYNRFSGGGIPQRKNLAFKGIFINLDNHKTVTTTLDYAMSWFNI